MTILNFVIVRIEMLTKFFNCGLSMDSNDPPILESFHEKDHLMKWFAWREISFDIAHYSCKRSQKARRQVADTHG